MLTGRRTSLSTTMESLKTAADKIKNSPRVVKKKIGSTFNREKLTDDWIHNRQNVINGVTFNVKVLGKEDIDDSEDKNSTPLVEKLVQQREKMPKNEKLQKVSIYVDNKKLLIRDLLTRQLEQDIPVYRISYCTADPKYPKVFTFIAREKASRQLYTHVFLTNKKAMAEAMALTVAQAFTMAYEEWEEKNQGIKDGVEKSQDDDAKEIYSGLGDEIDTSISESQQKNGNLLDSDVESITPRIDRFAIEDDVEDDNTTGKDDDFLIFAQSRTKKLNTGLVRKSTFKGNVKDYLAVNNTITDLDRALSTEDLFNSSPVLERKNPFNNSATTNNPFQVDQSSDSILDPYQQTNPFNQTTSNPFNANNEPFSGITPVIINTPASPGQSTSGNLIEF